MTEAERPKLNPKINPKINWMDLLWLVLLAALALLPPIQEYHKQLILLAFGVIQLGEGWLIARLPRRGPAYLVLLKIGLATLLIVHTGEIPINSYYYPIYYLPAVTAAEYFGPWATLLWTSLASGRLLLLSLSCAAGVRNHQRGLRTAGHPYRFLLSRRHGRQPFRDREPAPNAALPGTGRDSRGDEPPPGASAGRGPPV